MCSGEQQNAGAKDYGNVCIIIILLYSICRYSNVLQGNIHVRVQVLRKSVCISSSNSPHLLDVFYIYTIYYIYIYIYIYIYTCIKYTYVRIMCVLGMPPYYNSGTDRHTNICMHKQLCALNYIHLSYTNTYVAERC